MLSSELTKKILMWAAKMRLVCDVCTDNFYGLLPNTFCALKQFSIFKKLKDPQWAQFDGLDKNLTVIQVWKHIFHKTSSERWLLRLIQSSQIFMHIQFFANLYRRRKSENLASWVNWLDWKKYIYRPFSKRCCSIIILDEIMDSW